MHDFLMVQRPLTCQKIIENLISYVMTPNSVYTPQEVNLLASVLPTHQTEEKNDL